MNTEYVNVPEDQFLQVAAADYAPTKIKQQGGSLSYAWLRRSFGRQNGTFHLLNRGRAILQSSSELNQYLRTHGPMIESQWEQLAAALKVSAPPSRIFDYGCGQGLAGLLLYDRWGRDYFQQVKEICLIEASITALVRAEHIYRCIAPQASIRCLHKGFDDLGEEDLTFDADLPNTHILSNVLDIEGFDHIALCRKMLGTGSHTILAVSHDRESFGGTSRIFEAKQAVEALIEREGANVTFSDVHRFTCSNGTRSAAIAWCAIVEVA